MGTTVTEKRESPRGGIDSDGKESYDRSYQIETTAATIGPRTVRQALPPRGTAFTYGTDTSPKCTVQTITVKIDPNIATRWHGEVRYTENDNECDEEYDDPLDKPPTFEWDTIEEMEVVEKATKKFDEDDQLENQPVANSAGQAFDPPYTEPTAHLKCVMIRNEDSFTPQTSLSWQNKTNSDTFTIDGYEIEEDQALIKRITGRRIARCEGADYFVVTYEIHFQKSDWDRRPLDAGQMELVDGELKHIRAEGQPVSEAVPLDGAGAKKGAAQNAVYLRFATKDPIAYGPLQFE